MQKISSLSKLVFFLFFFSCVQEKVQSQECVCIEIFSPVCGEDGKTYANECKAKCAGVEVNLKGECSTD